MAHYKSDNRVRGNRYDGKYVKGPVFGLVCFRLHFTILKKNGFSSTQILVKKSLWSSVKYSILEVL